MKPRPYWYIFISVPFCIVYKVNFTFFKKKPQQSAALFDDEEDGLFAKPTERW